jgi:putative oxidoreductase
MIRSTGNYLFISGTSINFICTSTTENVMSKLKQQQEIARHIAELSELLPEENKKQKDALRDLAHLIARGTLGGLMAGHGAQKMLGWFDGPGMKGTAQMMSYLGLEEQPWTTLAGVSELGGGALTALGFFHPLGPIATLGAMGIAIGKAHWGKPIWASSGGSELAVLNAVGAISLALTKPGRYSLDRLFGIRVPRTISVLTTLVVIASVIVAIQKKSPAVPVQTEQPQPQAEEVPVA